MSRERDKGQDKIYKVGNCSVRRRRDRPEAWRSETAEENAAGDGREKMILRFLCYAASYALYQSLIPDEEYEQENIMEHSYGRIIAHALALVRRKYFAAGKFVGAGTVAVMALYHDLPEIMTGDIPTPVKYATKEMRASYRIVEQGAAQKLLAMLPAALQDEYRPLIFPSESDPVVQEMMQLVKAADRFSAYIKCLDELKAGNQEFRQAMVGVKERLEQMELPEVDWFFLHVIPSYYKTLDEFDD